jgi:hypothetical protein
MKRIILFTTFALGCSSHAYSAGYENGDNADGTGGSGGSGGFPTVDADVADRIIDAYEIIPEAAAEDSPPTDSGPTVTCVLTECAPCSALGPLKCCTEAGACGCTWAISAGCYP